MSPISQSQIISDGLEFYMIVDLSVNIAGGVKHS